MQSTLARRAVALSIAVCIAFLSISAPQPTSAADLEPLYELFEIDAAPVHHIVVVDLSGSMKDIFPQVRQAVSDYLGYIQPDDEFSLVVFADDADVKISARPGSEAADIGAQIPDPAPNAMTDIAAGLDAAISEAKASDASAHVVILLTDGDDQPPDGSPYLQYGDAKWDMLRARAEELPSGETLMGFGIGIGSNALGAPLISKVIPGAESFNVSVGALGSRLSTIRDSIRRERLRKAVEEELTSGSITIEAAFEEVVGLSAGENAVGRVDVTSAFEHLPVVVRVEVKPTTGTWPEFEPVSTDEIVTGLSLQQEIVLQPGEMSTFDLGFPADEASPPRSFIRRSEELTVAVVVSAEAITQFADEVSELGLDSSVKVDPAEAHTVVRYSWGMWLWQAGLALLALLAVAVLVFLRIRPRPRLVPSGHLEISQPGEQLGKGLAISIDLKKEAAGASRVVLASADVPDTPTVVLERAGQAQLIFEAKRGEKRREVITIARPGGYGLVTFRDPGRAADASLTQREIAVGDKFRLGSYEIRVS